MHPRLDHLLSLAVAAVLFGLCGLQQPRLVALRAEHALTPDSAIAGVPPMVAFTTIALGGFRGILADMLWLRATTLQDDGRYVELAQLAHWITQLEPRSPGTWEFHAWNMAYNVSAMMADPAERWHWVQNGIRLLREDGLRYNPRDARLHFVVGWFFQHKLGARADPAWRYYQQRLAVEVDRVLPGGTLAGLAPTNAAAVAAALQEGYGLDVAAMRGIDARFGPLDWRLPESQALYWAARGLQRSGQAHHRLCERMVTQCMGLTFLQGHLDLDEQAGRYARGPRPELLDHALGAYQAMLAGPNAIDAGDAYAAFLKRAADVLIQSGRPADAARVQALMGP